MAALVDPRYFQIGNAFMGGMEQAQQDQRRNALTDLEFRQQDFRENAYANEQAQMQQQMQAQGQQQAQSRAALAELLQSEGLDPQWANLPEKQLEAVLERHFAEQEGPASMPADVQTAQWYANASPELRRAFDTTKRNPTAPIFSMINGVPSLVERTPDRLGTTTPLSSQESELAFASQKESALTGAGERAKVQVAAQADLPRVSNNADQAIKALDDLSSDPGFDKIFGVYSLAPVIPGTSQANAFAKWEQIQGKAFLEAFQSLKGGGQITEVEGQKATAAITTLANRKQSPGAARKAIKDLKEVVEAGRKRAQQKAKQFNQPAGQGQVIDFSELPD